VEKSGAWFSYKGERIGQGKDNARTFLKEHPEIRDELENLIRENILVSVDEEQDNTEDSVDSEILGIDL